MVGYPDQASFGLDHQFGRYTEAAWQKGSSPAIAEYLPEDGPVRRSVLIELVMIDLDHRWRSRQTFRRGPTGRDPTEAS